MSVYLQLDKERGAGETVAGSHGGVTKWGELVGRESERKIGAWGLEENEVPGECPSTEALREDRRPRKAEWSW